MQDNQEIPEVIVDNSPIDIHYVHVSNIKAEIPVKLATGDNIAFQGLATVKKFEGEDNEDGTKTYIFKAKPKFTQFKVISRPELKIIEQKEKNRSPLQRINDKIYVYCTKMGKSKEEYREIVRQELSSIKEAMSQVEQKWVSKINEIDGFLEHPDPEYQNAEDWGA